LPIKVLKNQPLKSVLKNKIVKLTTMGNIQEIMIIEKLQLDGFPIKKISKTEYMIIETGEVMEYKVGENRAENKESLRKTFKKIRQLINTNFTGEKNELAFTITYDSLMTNTKVLYNDFKHFMEKLRKKYSNVEYISVVEPQGSGSWHCHILLKFMELNKIYILNKEINEMWGHGFVTVKAIKQNVDNLGAYLSAYLGDIPLDEGQGSEGGFIKEVEINGKKKKFIKGGRLHMYPPGMNIYRASRGIKQPTKEYMRYDKAKKIVGAVTPNYSTCIKILDDDGIEINSIAYENYNSKRK